MHLRTASLLLWIVSTGAEVTAGPMTFRFSGDVFQSNSVSGSAFRLGTTVEAEFTVEPASSYAAGIHTFSTVASQIFGDGLFNHPLWSGFVLASDNHSLIEPAKSIDEVIIVLADAKADRPLVNGGHGVEINDPRGGPAEFRTIGVRLRLTGPTSWFDASADSQATLAALPRYEMAEAWAEFEDFALEGRAYADFNLLHLGFVPESGGLVLAAIACIVYAACRQPAGSRGTRKRWTTAGYGVS